MLNLIALIGSNRKVIEKQFKKFNFTLEDYGDYDEYTYGVYVFGNRKLNVKFKVVGDNEFAETIIII